MNHNGIGTMMIANNNTDHDGIGYVLGMWFSFGLF